jgi:excisionase family DNA binding protein
LKAELHLSEEIVESIATKVVEQLKPCLNNNGKEENKDSIYDVRGLAEYLGVSPKWVYQRVQYKEIPHIKRKGLLRFRKKEIDKWLNAHNVPSIN